MNIEGSFLEWREELIGLKFVEKLSNDLNYDNLDQLIGDFEVE